MRQVLPCTYWLTCMLLLVADSVLSQGYNFNYRHFSVEDGLSSRFINNVVQDDQGFIWLGTSSGVNRFDGKNFKVFYSSDENRRPYAYSFLHKSPDGKIWVNYDHRSVDILDPVTGTSIPLVKLAPQLKGKNISLVKTGSKNEIWGTIGKKGFFRYDGKFHFSKTIDLKHAQPPCAPTPWGTFLLTSSDGTLEYDFEGSVVNRYPQKWIFVTQKSTDSTLYLLTIGYNQGNNYPIQLWQLKKNTPLQLVKLTRNGIPFTLRGANNSISSIGINTDEDGNIWITLPGYLLIFDKTGALKAEESQQEKYWEQFESREIFFDTQHQAWVCAKDGVYAISTERSKFRRLLQNPKIGFSMRGITELPDGYLLACGYDGVFKINLQTGSHEKLSDAVRFGVKKASDNRVWFGAHSSSTFRSAPNSLDLKENALGPDVPSIEELLRPFEDSETGTIYYGCRRHGLLVFNEKTNQLEPYRQFNSFAPFATAEILDMYPTRECIWVSTSIGLYKMDRKKGLVAGYSQFPVKYIFHIAEDKDGVFWLSTGGGGLLRWNSNNNTYRQYSTANGLSSNTIYAAYDDGLGYLWLPSNYGLMRFEKSTGIVYNYLTTDGISHEEFNSSSHYRSPDGTFYFGGLDGITAFKPKEIKDKQFDAPLVVIAYKVLQDNHLDDRTDIFRQEKSIVIQPDERFFTFDFALLDHSVSKKLYAWRLEGLDNSWTYQEDNTIRLNALPYGNFTLRVRAQAAGNNWSKNEITIPVTILPPFYMTWKFAILCISGVALLTFLFINWRTRWLRREKVRLSSLVDERTRELIRKNVELESLNHTKDRLFAIIAHDLRSPLVTLGGLARKVAFLISKNRTEEVYELGETLENAVSNVRNLLDNLLKWSIVQDGSFPHHPEQLSAKEVVDEVVGLYENVAEAKGILLVATSMGEPTIFADRNSVSTVIRNLVDNAIKFTKEKGKIEVAVENKAGSCYIQVSDTGVGIAPEALSGIFTLKSEKTARGTNGEKGNGLGLVLCRELLGINQGAIDAFNKTGGGTVFVVKLPATEVGATSLG